MARGIVVALVAIAVAVAGFVVFGGSAGASDLKVEFLPGETHTYRIEITARGRAGNLDGGFATDMAIGADLTQTTGAVDGDGNATLNYTLKNFTFSENGRRTTPPPGVGTAFSVKMRPDGSVVELEGGDPFGLEEVNPAGQFVNPSNAGPLLPKEKIEPGESWTVKTSQSLPDIGRIDVEAVNTLVERRKIGGNEAAVIRSLVKVPMNIRIGHDELARQAENDGEDASGIPGNAAVSMVGNMTFNLTQTIFTANGLLQSALGDMNMRGTMSIEGVGPTPLSVAFDLDFEITMLKTSTVQSA